MWIEILNDLQKVLPSIISAKFHQGLSTAISNLIIETYRWKRKNVSNTNVVALSGGYLNQILKNLTEKKLKKLFYCYITSKTTIK